MKLEKYDLTYLTIDSVQEGVGASQITPLLLGLAKAGRRICLVSFEKSPPPLHLIEKYSQAGIDWQAKEFKSRGVKGGVRRLFEMRNSLPETNIIHGRSDLPTAAAHMSRIDAPVLWDVRGLWSDQRLEMGTRGWNSLTSKGARFLEDYSAKNSDGMVTLTKAIVPILEERHSYLPIIRDVVPTCVQTSMFVPSTMPSGTLTCLLSGTFNDYYDLVTTKELIARIRENRELRVIWARPSESPRKTLDVGEDIIISASHSEMPSLIARAHFGIAVLRSDNPGSSAAAVPTKVGEFLASGRPMVINLGVGDLDQMLSNSSAGVLINTSLPLGEQVTQIFDLISDPGTPSRCRSLALENFDMDVSIQKYSRMYDLLEKNA